MKYLLTATLLSTTLIFSACSGIQAGFDEGSLFYTKPEKIVLKPMEKNVESTKNVKTTEVSPLETQEKVETKMQEEQENETTFSYEKEAGYE